MRVPQFYVRSNVHMTNLDNAIQRLLVNESLIDVTLACDGHRFQCHRLVLAAASPLFEELLKEHPKEHPIVIIPIGVKWHILKSLIDFMYRGQTCINQAELKTLIESAELLQVIGLYDPQTQFREIYGEEDGEQTVNVDEDNVNENKEENEENGVEDQELNQPNTSLDETNTDHEENQSHSQEDQDQDQNEENQDVQVQNHGENVNEDENNVEMASEEKNNKEVIVDYIEIDDSQDELSLAEEADCTVPEGQKDDQIAIINEESDQLNYSTLMNPEIHKETTKIAVDVDGTEVGEIKLLESDILQSVPNVATTSGGTTETTATNEIMPTIRVKPTIKLINLFKINRPGDGNQSPSKVPWTYIHIPATSGSNIKSPSEQVPLRNPFTGKPLPKLLPKPAPVVISNPPVLQQDSNETTVACAGVVPSFLKFNSSSMAISVKNLDRTKTREKLNVLNMAFESESPEQEQLVKQPPECEDEDETNHQQDVANVHEELDLGKIKQEHEVKTEAMDFDSDRESKTEEDGAENIICQPNVSYIYDGQDYGKDVEHVDEDEDGVCIDYDRLVAETYGNMSKAKKKPIIKKCKKSKAQQRSSTATTASSCNNLPLYNTTKLESTTNNYHHLHQRLKNPPTLVPLSVINSGLGPKQHLYYHHNNKTNTKMEIDEKIDNGFSNSVFEDTTPLLDSPDSHTQNAVILRNPRCNQPRHYSNESLYAALMAVKYGDSIYRASRLHQVPRKTLRNWMKRWDIKSQYPMPKQLKDAAKKKKLNQNQSA